MLTAQPFLVSAANTLALEVVEACVRGDAHFRRVLVTGPEGSGKSTLLAYARRLAGRHASEIHFSDPLVWPRDGGDFPSVRVLATLADTAPSFRADLDRFCRLGGRIVSLALDAETVLAMARHEAAGLRLTVHPDALQLLVQRLQTPSRVRGALQRLQAEAVIGGRHQIDVLFVIRVLGDYLYPR